MSDKTSEADEKSQTQLHKVNMLLPMCVYHMSVLVTQE